MLVKNQEAFNLNRCHEGKFIPAVNDPAYYQVWQQRWGEIAKPLLWSYTMYIVLPRALES